jgi:hypothetical protein
MVRQGLFRESGASLTRLQLLEKVVRAGRITGIVQGGATIQSQPGWDRKVRNAGRCVQ